MNEGEVQATITLTIIAAKQVILAGRESWTPVLANRESFNVLLKGRTEEEIKKEIEAAIEQWKEEIWGNQNIISLKNSTQS